MLTQEKLDRIAEIAIPPGTHPYLHVDCQTAWIKRVKVLIKRKHIKPNIKNLTILAKNWESLLFNYYSTQN
jgi:hypothetical protein